MLFDLGSFLIGVFGIGFGGWLINWVRQEYRVPGNSRWAMITAQILAGAAIVLGVITVAETFGLITIPGGSHWYILIPGF